jgi:hypothetical protein
MCVGMAVADILIKFKQKSTQKSTKPAYFNTVSFIVCYNVCPATVSLHRIVEDTYMLRYKP